MAFEGRRGGGANARFSALEPLQRLLPAGDGLASADFLERCNALGVDALEAAQCLTLLVPEGSGAQDVLDALARACTPGQADEGFGLGSQALALRLGRTLPGAQGEAVRPAHHFAETLAREVAVRGAEPMRVHSFLVGDRVHLERMRAVVAPMELPAGSEDPASPVGKGRLCWWHENLSAALDVLGICTFSAAGLLTDGVLELEELARAVLPGELPERRAADALLSLGAEYLARFRARNGGGEPQVAEELRDQADEYRRLRAWSQAHLHDGRAGVWPGQPDGGTDLVPGTETQGAWSGTVCTQGFLARHLPERLALELEAQPSAADLVRLLAQRYPRAAASLVREGRPIPAVLVGDRVLGPGDPVPPGGEVLLLLAISGG
ncbi:MAG: hypothetical protein R3E96_16595 [Planctomycetota bacterium]